ncbi:MAG: hypothetical protein ACE15B_23860 [Bryobacteraceae bacterium]
MLLEGDAAEWRQIAAAAGWRFLAPWAETQEKSLDLRLRALDAKLAAARQQGGVDATRIYAAAQGEGAAALFYAVSRMPDLWTAAVAVGGNARQAIDSNRLFGANTGNVPVLWISGNAGDEALAKRMQAAGFNLEWKMDPAAKAGEVIAWLGAKRRDRFPARVDCETGTPAFARCYWIEMTAFDLAERNDALDSTRVPPVGTGASLDLGGFGYNPAAPGPGVEVAWLPPNHPGSLKLGDRIVSVGGKAIENGAAYARMMDETAEERPVAVLVQRGKERIRLETRVIVPRREEVQTARVQGQYSVEAREILVLSRAVTGMRLTVPAEWAPAAVNWNGVEAGKVEAGGCWLLRVEKGLITGRKCP